MPQFTQEKRHIRLATVLGKDVLLVEAFHGDEGMSRLFRYELSLLSENQGIKFEEIIGTAVTVALDLPWGRKRFLNGIISKFAQVSGSGTAGDDTRVSHYRATMVPWFWLLGRSAESRIYQNMSVPDIAEKIFKDHGFSDFQLKLQGSYQKREYCVQYRETHSDFISRLLESEGIHYFFEHTDGKHKMIVAD
ncbi:MAG TPA: type VI secretion system tip protein TssI/VgrG, partial [Geomonas sp.]